MHPIETAYAELKAPIHAEGVAGLRVSGAYPSQFQATDFPRLAGDGAATMLGNNQAFFFVRNPINNEIPAQLQTDTSKLEELMKNVRENGTKFTLLMDADVTENPAAFVEKYAHLRPERPVLGKAMLAQEAKLIGEFLQNGGLQAVAKKVIGDGKELPDAALTLLADKFLAEQFHVEGVQTEKALDAAVWKIDGPQGELMARQEYAPATENVERKWLVGTRPELEQMVEQNADAKQLLAAVAQMEVLPKRDMQSVHNQLPTQTHQR